MQNQTEDCKRSVAHVFHPAAAPGARRARLLAEVQTLDEGDLDRALDYLGLLRLARLHRPAPRVATAAPA